MLTKWFTRLYYLALYLIFIVLLANLFAPMLAQATPIPNVFINEIHYDNSGIDENEFIELAGIAGLSLEGWSIHLYNGNNGNVYGYQYTFADFILADSHNGFGFAAVNFTDASFSIQNGSPDGVVLADEHNNIIQFLSYEGSFIANSGIAAGIMSTDIGVMEASNTAVGYSLQLTGQGSQYQDFTWASPQGNTFGTVNTTQIFTPTHTSTPVQVSEPENISILMIVAFLLLIFSSKNKQTLTLGIRQKRIIPG